MNQEQPTEAKADADRPVERLVMPPHWTEERWSWRKRAGFMTLSVMWDSTRPKGYESGYTARAGDARLKHLFKTKEEAAHAAEEAARRLLRGALAALGE